MASRQPQVRQREERHDVLSVLGHTAESHLHQAELALDQPKRALDFRAHARLAVLLLMEAGLL